MTVRRKEYACCLVCGDLILAAFAGIEFLEIHYGYGESDVLCCTCYEWKEDEGV